MSAEVFVAVVPSARISAECFLSVLSDNQVPSRLIGAATAVCGSRRVPGVMVIALVEGDLHRAQAHARLCGIDFLACNSRANVV